MNDYFQRDTYSRAGDWLMTTARRNPEGLLLLAAGCVLLMRGGGSFFSRGQVRRDFRHQDFDRAQARYSGGSLHSMENAASHAASQAGNAASQAGAAVSRMGDTAGEYASNIRDRVSDKAGEYADSVSEFARDTRQTISDQSERLRRQAQSSMRYAQSSMQDGVNRVLREQPLAVAVAGLAAGAAIAAVFRSTAIENRAFGGAHEALSEAASKAGENLMGAASRAGERFKTAAAERGFTTDNLKNLAGDVASSLTETVVPAGEATTVPQGGKAADAKNKGTTENRSGGFTQGGLAQGNLAQGGAANQGAGTLGRSTR